MQPVVILGGFLITDEAYGPMAEWLNAQGGLDVSMVHASRLDWLLTSSAWGWQRLLQRVDQSVKQARERCAGAPVTLIGHSSCLLYTSPSPRDVEESRMPSSA